MSCKSVHCTAKMLLKAAQAEATSCPSCQLSTTASTTRRRRRSCCSMTAGYVHTPALESCADCLSLAGRRRRRRREAGRQAGSRWGAGIDKRELCGIGGFKEQILSEQRKGFGLARARGLLRRGSSSGSGSGSSSPETGANGYSREFQVASAPAPVSKIF